MLVHANDLKIKYNQAVGFAEQHTVKLLHYLFF